jgi:ATP-dependent helicase/nuclease subunit B
MTDRPVPGDHAAPPRRNAAGVYTVASDQPFLAAVARGVLARLGDDPLRLSDLTILVPNRDTGFQLKQAFMEQLGGRPGIMPRIDAPGDIDDGYLSLRMADNQVLSQALMDIPPPVTRLERQLILATEIMKIPGMASSLQKAVKLGGELGNFLDELQSNNIQLRDIDRLVPPEFKKQWGATAEFLKIITDAWPKKLQEMGQVDPEEHRNALIQIQAAHWQMSPPKKPVIAVGFSDTDPATLSLLKAVIGTPGGAVVLPGVDLGLDDKSWDVMTSVHPQYAFKKILTAMDASRKDIKTLEGAPSVPQHARANDPELTSRERQKLLREAMRPAGTAEGWSHLKAQKKPQTRVAKLSAPANDDKTISPAALNGMDLVTCGSPQEEASVIALKMRETLEVSGRTAMLVTADRSLARRVSARLKYWDINVDDGAGLSLADTSAGVYLVASAHMATEEWSPVPLLEALKHPLATLGESKADFREKLAAIEDMVLHGPRPGAGAEGIKNMLAAAFNRQSRRPDQTLSAEELATKQAELTAFVDRIDAAGKSFFDMVAAGKPQPFAQYLDAHIRFAEALAAEGKKKGADRIWRGDDGVKAARFLTQLKDAAARLPDVTGRDYVDVLQGLMRDVTVQPTSRPHPQLKIVTPEQAVLQKADVVIIGGINDDVWPRKAAENPWLSPDMIKKLGLREAEESIGRGAHQFVQMASNPNVLLSRSVRSGDAPTVSSPFLTRLMMVLKGAGIESAIESRDQLRDIHAAMHTPAEVTPIDPPAPTPPVSARPKKLPVTAVESLMRDPYTVYAKYVLKIRPRDPLDASPSVSEKGIFTHDALDEFVKKYPDKLPDNALEELLKIGEETFKARMNNPTVQSFWWPRFERIAKWFVKFESERRELSRTVGTEVNGKLEIDLGNGDVFTLTAIADRIDRDSEDQLQIIDYKTGSVPLQKAVGLGFSPQLTLEALIAFTGGFKGIDAGDVGSLQYWKLSGGRPAAEVTEVRGDVKKLVGEAREGIENLMKAFNDPKTPYLSNPRPEWAPRYQNYEHLSRSGEWGTVSKTNNKKQPRKTTQRRRGTAGGNTPGGKGGQKQ